jgi:hypothetical protein
MKTGGCRQTLLLCFTLILLTVCSGCARQSAAEAGIDDHKETYYFDAQLAFAIEHPADWKLLRGGKDAPASCTVRWQSPPEREGEEPVVRAEVSACPSLHESGGSEKMREDFLLAHPTLVLTEDKVVELPGGTGLMLVGTDPMRTYLAAFLPSANRGYILTFSAPGEKFDSYRPLFAEMLESFRSQQGR